ncbi:MAG: DUF742 domain-containing protein [Actinomycetota bacterium]
MSSLGVPPTRSGPPAAGGATESSNDLVRAFVLTGGRTRAEAPELAIETVVSQGHDVAQRRATLRREECRIVDVLAGPMSIAEVSAHLTIPLRAAIVLISELVAAGALVAGRSADTGDTDFLLKIRSALQLL